MRARRRFTALAIATLAVCIAGQPRTAIGAAQPQHPIPAAEARVDINHASEDELLKVPGMTRSWADRIVRFRPYRSKQELLDKGIVTDKVYDRIKDFVIAHRDKQ